MFPVTSHMVSDFHNLFAKCSQSPFLFGSMPFCRKESGSLRRSGHSVAPNRGKSKGHSQSKQVIFLCPFAAPALHTRPARYTGDSLWRWFTVDPFLLLRSLHGLSAGYGICASFRDGASSFRIPVVIRYRQVISFPPPPWGFAEPAFFDLPTNSLPLRSCESGLHCTRPKTWTSDLPGFPQLRGDPAAAFRSKEAGHWVSSYIGTTAFPVFWTLGSLLCVYSIAEKPGNVNSNFSNC